MEVTFFKWHYIQPVTDSCFIEKKCSLGYKNHESSLIFFFLSKYLFMLSHCYFCMFSKSFFFFLEVFTFKGFSFYIYIFFSLAFYISLFYLFFTSFGI